uniref:Uncharacterized protein n=1 Tax=Clastoptera arizonana TaxID=38151 RepID=A0A1B6C4X9_9HEMI
MGIKLYFLDLSPPCRTVDLVVHHLGLKVEYINVNLLAGEHLQPEFIKINPTHTIPAIDNDGFILYESHAICAYLMSKYGKEDSLYPKDLYKRAKVDEQLHYSNELFALFKYITRPILYDNNTVVSEEKKKAVLEKYNVLERALAGQDYFAGNQLTIADLSNISFVPLYQVYVPLPKDKFPRLTGWISRCEQNITKYNEVNGKGLEALRNLILAKLNEK